MSVYYVSRPAVSSGDSCILPLSLNGTKLCTLVTMKQGVEILTPPFGLICLVFDIRNAMLISMSTLGPASHSHGT